jgi:hypothetical protein
LGQRLLGAGPARVAGVLYALDPLMVVSGALFYAEAAATIVLLLTLLAAWSAVPDRLAWSLVAGLLLGVLAELRPVGLVLAPVVALWVAAYVPRRRLRHAIAVVAGCGLALAPWTLRNYRVHGGLVPISTAGTQSAPVDAEDVSQHGLTASLVRAMWHDPGGTASRIASEFAHFWAPYPTRLLTDSAQRRAAFHAEDSRLPTDLTFSPGLRDPVSALSFGAEMAFAFVGVVLAWRRHRAAAALLLAVCIAYGLGYALIIGKLRYRIPVLPYVFLFAGVALTWAMAGAAQVRGLIRREPAVTHAERPDAWRHHDGPRRA